ncbi:hypothetical protein AB4Z40_24625 [Bosea sp. 2YAB26]
MRRSSLADLGFQCSVAGERDKWVQSSPRYLLANNVPGVPEATITRLKQR